jgi:hypothetical protein
MLVGPKQVLLGCWQMIGARLATDSLSLPSRPSTVGNKPSPKQVLLGNAAAEPGPASEQRRTLIRFDQDCGISLTLDACQV